MNASEKQDRSEQTGVTVLDARPASRVVATLVERVRAWRLTRAERRLAEAVRYWDSSSAQMRRSERFAYRMQLDRLERRVEKLTGRASGDQDGRELGHRPARSTRRGRPR